ncbi:uncharacterized protein [Solanum tuberosum]|uniref:uncharacterized protein isoform X1 n=1 Tax=Solanum tuberosum TaxID=4113 RepID=UPI00073A0442|nr:PREDICTED: uncharacterized protein LOC102599538 isoform X1 [Solanum tuberosum]
MPTELRTLFLNSSEESEHFRTYVRTYNNMFAFTSLGVKYDKDLAKRYHGIYTFKVQGKMYHFIDDLSTGKGKNLQLYFYDNENEVANRIACSTRIHEGMIIKLMNILQVSPCNGKGKKLTTIPNLLNCCLQITSLDYKQSSLIRPGRFFKKIGKAKACVMRPVVGDPFTKGVEQGPQLFCMSAQLLDECTTFEDGNIESAQLFCIKIF